MSQLTNLCLRVVLGSTLVFSVVTSSAQAEGPETTGAAHESGAAKLPAAGRHRGIFDSVAVDLSIPVRDESKLTEDEKHLLHDINYGRPTSFALISRAWLERYRRYFNQKYGAKLSAGEVASLLRKVTADLNFDDPHQFKLDLERRVEELTGKKIVYNVDYNNPIDVLVNAKADCSAGSLCQSFATRDSLGAAAFERGNFVKILTEGHILSGYVDREGNLVGVESTTAGISKRNFGRISDLAKFPHPVRVVDSNLFAVYEIFKDHLSADDEARLGRDVLRKTALRYGIPFEETERKVVGFRAAQEKTAANDERKPDPMNQSSMAFGKAAVPRGDLPRLELGEADGAQELPRATMGLAPQARPVPGTMEDFLDGPRLGGPQPMDRELFMIEQLIAQLADVEAGGEETKKIGAFIVDFLKKEEVKPNGGAWRTVVEGLGNFPSPGSRTLLQRIFDESKHVDIRGRSFFLLSRSAPDEASARWLKSRAEKILKDAGNDRYARMAYEAREALDVVNEYFKQHPSGDPR